MPRKNPTEVRAYSRAYSRAMVELRQRYANDFNELFDKHLEVVLQEIAVNGLQELSPGPRHSGPYREPRESVVRRIEAHALAGGHT